MTRLRQLFIRYLVAFLLLGTVSANAQTNAAHPVLEIIRDTFLFQPPSAASLRLPPQPAAAPSIAAGSVQPLGRQPGALLQSLGVPVPSQALTCAATSPQPIEIVVLAAALKCDLDLIFEYVHNNIEYEPLYGSNKGALGTLLDGRGDAWDQSVLMIALLNAAGYAASYVSGEIQFTTTSTPSVAQALNWLGVANDAEAVANMLGTDGGIANNVTPSTGAIQSLLMVHMWVAVQIGGTTYYFDPSFKQHTISAGFGSAALANALGYSRAQFLADAGGNTSDGLSVFGINRTAARSDLVGYASNLVNYIKQRAPTAAFTDVVGGKTIQPLLGSPIRQTSLPYATGVLILYPSIPSPLRTTLTITMPGQTSGIGPLYTDQVYGHRITVFTTPTNCTTNCVGQLLIDGSPPSTGGPNTSTPPVNSGSAWSVGYSISQPYGLNGGQVVGSGSMPIIAGGSYLIYAAVGQVGRSMVERHRMLLAQARAAGNSDTSEVVLGETLAMIGLGRLAERSAVQQTLDQILQTTTQYHFAIGIAGQACAPAQTCIVNQSGLYGPYVDGALNFITGTSQVSGGPTTVVAGTAYPTAAVSWVFAEAAAASILESAILEQTQAPVAGMQAASTEKMVDINASDSSTQGRVYFADGTTQAGRNTFSSTILPAISSYYTQDNDLNNIETAVLTSHQQVLIPLHGNLNLAQWLGAGYKAITPGLLGGFGVQELITGGLNGGFAALTISDPAPDTQVTVTPTPADQLVSSLIDTSPAIGDLKLSEPIDAVTGAYTYKRDDLVTGGGAFPYALPFTRSYSSAASLVDNGLGKGWGHTYGTTVQLNSDPYQALLGPSPISAASAIAALFVMQDLSSVTPDALHLTLNAMVARWLGDQITNNAVTVNWPDTSEEFLQLPRGDGSATVGYNPPLGSATVLTGALPDQYGRPTTFTYQRKDQLSLAFGPNPKGQQVAWSSLTGWTFPNGMSVSVNYDAATGLPSAVRNNIGRGLSFTYSGTTPPHIASVSDETGRQVTYGYDGNGNLTSYADPLGFVTIYAYDTSGVFDTMGHLTQVFCPSFPSNAFVANWYDALGRVSQQSDANGNAWHFFFAGSRTEQIDAIGNRQVSYQTLRGKVLMDAFVMDGGSQDIFSDTPQSNGHVNVTTNQYDSQDRLILTTAPESNAITYAYSPDLENNVVQVVAAAKPGSPAPTTKLWNFTYDPTFNKVASVHDPRGLTAQFTYDGRGNLIQTIADAGDATHFNLTSKYTYDQFGRVLTATDRVGTVTQNTYDAFENLVSTVADAGSGRLNLTTTFAYDAFGDLSARTDPRGNTTVMTYDAARRQLATTAPAPFNTGSTLVQTTNAYDPDGRVTSVARANGGTTVVTQTTYSKSGKKLSVTDPNGNQTTYTYDADDRQATVTQPVAPSISRVTSYGYDPMGRPATVTDNLGNIAATYTYTPNGRQASFTDAHTPAGSGNLTNYAYDGFDRLSQVTYAAGTGLATSESFAYDIDDNLVSRTTRNGDQINFTYDTLNRLASEITMATDLAATVTPVAPSGGTPVQYATNYAYDQLNRPTGATWSPAPTAVAPSGPSSVTFTHTYNAANQRTSLTPSSPGWSSPPATAPTVAYTANALNQYSAVGSVTPTYDNNGNLTYDGTFTYGYDAENRLTSVSQGATSVASYAYDGQHNRNDAPVALATGPPAQAAAPGRRKLKIAGSMTSAYVSDWANREVLEYDGTTGAPRAWYAYGLGSNDVLNRMDLGAGMRQTLVPDIQGSIIATVDSSTGTLAPLNYQPYGESTVTTGSFAYAAMRIDAETNGLYYARARTYSPTLGRFLQTDPVGYAGGRNLYAYVENDPLNGVDTAGTESQQTVQQNEASLEAAASGGGLGGGGNVVAATAPSDNGRGIWGLDPISRGILIENNLAASVYRDWYRIGQERGGYFPLFDFQRGNTLVSVRSIDTSGSTWFGRTTNYIDDLARSKATVNGVTANIVLDVRVPPGGSMAAAPLITYGRQMGITVVVSQYP